jgi:hypothetical protein
MTKFLSQFVTRSGLVVAGILYFIGLIDFFRAYQRHDSEQKIIVVVLYFIVMPAFALWAKRKSIASPDVQEPRV